MNSKFASLMLAMLLAACGAAAPAPDAQERARFGQTGFGVCAPQQLRQLPWEWRRVAAAVRRYTRAGDGHAAGHIDDLSRGNRRASEPLSMEVIFTTPAGFRDQVDFVVDPDAKHIDFKSRSLFGVYDWGKNRSRMQEFRGRFEQRAGL